MKLYLIRHGESETNRSGLWTGWLDVSLTEQGKAQAERVGRFLADVPFDKVYASDLVRARTTAEIALPAHEYESLQLLREINVGNIAGKPLGVLSAAEKEIQRKEGYTIFGGESRAEMEARVRAFLKMLEEQPGENIAAFSHAGFLRKALDVVLGIDMPHKNMLCRNCTTAIFEYENGTWKLHSWLNF